MFSSLRYFVFLSIVVFTSGVLASPPLQDLDLQRTQALLKTGKINMVSLSKYYLARIDSFDKHGPMLNAIAQMNPQLLQQAQALDKKIASHHPLGKLFGALIVVKDNIDVKGLSNTAGSWLLRDNLSSQDAFLVQRLLAEDALILAKTNLSEWANFRSEMSSSGWSSLHGQTLNPHDPTRSPCGSSSGSGAAIAADFALLAVGTETDGSITCPAAVNGIVGIKPTLGLISRNGIIPLAHSQDTAGPMARSVEDAVAMLDVMMAPDPSDKQALSGDPLTRFLVIGGLKGKRIGIMRNLMAYHPALDEVFDKQIKILEQAGAVLIDHADIVTKGQWGDAEYRVLLHEFKADLNHYLTSTDAPFKSLQQAIALNEQYANITMPIFGQDIWLKAQDSENLSSQTYLDALNQSRQLTREQGIDATLAKFQLDMLIAPTTAPAWKIDHINGDHYLGSAGSVAAVSGYPHITVPMGQVQHLPVNISFIGAKLSEAVLVQAAYEFEQRSQARIRPAL